MNDPVIELLEKLQLCQDSSPRCELCGQSIAEGQVIIDGELVTL